MPDEPDEPDEPELDLHADSEAWSDNREDATCEECGGPRVVFIPVAENGSGLFTVDEIEEIIGRARMRILEEWEKTESQGLEPMSGALPTDVVLRIDGYLDGSFRAVIMASGGGIRQTRVRYGRGSEYTGSFGWRHGLAVSRHTHQVTTEEEAAEGLLAYEGEPGILNFTKRPPYLRNQEAAQERFRLEQALRDRTSRSRAWDRNAAGRAGPRPPATEDGDAGAEAEAGGGQAPE